MTLDKCFQISVSVFHKYFIIRDSIVNAGHTIVYRAPYWSCDGAIDYVFNTIHTELEMDGAV
jgi:hypothetical protein